MNKMREYERGREDGLDLALRIVRQGGLEALEKEVKFRNITGVHTSLAVKDLDKASEQIKAMTLDTWQRWQLIEYALLQKISEEKAVENGKALPQTKQENY